MPAEIVGESSRMTPMTQKPSQRQSVAILLVKAAHRMYGSRNEKREEDHA
jgi:hypothetical protein